MTHQYQSNWFILVKSGVEIMLLKAITPQSFYLPATNNNSNINNNNNNNMEAVQTYEI
jgi:hypothetical protein